MIIKAIQLLRPPSQQYMSFSGFESYRIFSHVALWNKESFKIPLIHRNFRGNLASMRSNHLETFLCVNLSLLIPLFFLYCIQTLYYKLSYIFKSCSCRIANIMQPCSYVFFSYSYLLRFLHSKEALRMK